MASGNAATTGGSSPSGIEWDDAGQGFRSVFERLRTPPAVLAIVLLLILAYTATTRLEGLGRKPYHHDESIHALHSYQLYRGEGWQYDPVYHGPVVYYFNAVAYFLFGDSDYTGRVMPAIFGIILVLMALALAPELGVLEALYGAAFIALSPTLYYFSRFVRDDVYSACWAMMMVLGYLRYLRVRQTRWLYWCVVGLALGFCSKINVLIIGFIFCSSLLLYAAWYALFGASTARSNTAKARLEEIAVRHGVVARSLMLFGGVVLLIASYVVLRLPSYPARGPAQPWFWIVGLGAVVVAMGFVDWLLGKWSQREGGPKIAGGIYARHREVVYFTIVFMAIFGLFYTNFLKLVPLSGGRTDTTLAELLGNAFLNGLHYWYGQQLHPRIADVWYYYVPRIIIYELPLAILVIVGGFLRLTDRQRFVLIAGLLIVSIADLTGATAAFSDLMGRFGLTVMEAVTFAALVLVGGFLAHDELVRGRPERALLVYWSVLSFIIYAKANEKVPWLGVHVVLPLALYGGALAADLHRYLRARRLSSEDDTELARGVDPRVEQPRPRGRRLAIATGILSIVYYVHAGVVLNVQQEADPREIMVYVQSTTDVLDVVKELEDIAYRDGTYYETHFTIEDEASWPLSWYLRRYTKVAHLPTIANLEAETAAVLTNYPPADQTRALLENNGYEGTRYRLRAWWQPVWELDESDTKEMWGGYPHFLSKMLAYIAWRKIFPPEIGSTDFMFYRKSTAADSGSSGDGVAKPPEEQPRLPEAIVPQALVSPQIIGGPGQALGQFQQPRGMAIGPNGSLYVVDTVNSRVQRFSPQGDPLGAFGSAGSEPGQFKDPGGIAVDKDGFVYVADVWNHRIQKFTADGQFVLTWGKEPDFYGPRDVAVSSDGRIYVSDTGHHKIVSYSSTGEYLQEWGVKGTRHRQFTEPVGLAIGPDQLIYVADTGNRRVQVFDLNGKFERSFAIVGWDYIYSEPYMAFDSVGRLWLTDSKNNRVQAYATNGRFLGALGAANELEGPIGIAADKEGNLYIADTSHHRLARVTLSSQSVAAP